MIEKSALDKKYKVSFSKIDDEDLKLVFEVYGISDVKAYIRAYDEIVRLRLYKQYKFNSLEKLDFIA